MIRSGTWLRWTAFGMLALQVGWILALPPFRGIDEFDHAYRADAVAHGEWVARPEAATRGTGAVLSVSRSVVEAARPECQRLSYTGPEDCVGTPEGDRVAIASGAGRYNPVYYALVGYPGAVFDGTASLYAMRVVSTLLCTGLLVWALAAMTVWSGGRGVVAVLLVTTPMIVYSTTVVAPNGLEIVAGLAFWAALGGLAHVPTRDRQHLALATVSGALLVSLRSLGPLWATLILLAALLAWPGLGARLRTLLRERSGRSAVVVGLVVGLTSVVWILSQRSLVIGTEEVRRSIPLAERVLTASHELLLWPLQSIAAFPLRNEPAPVVVYAVYALLLIGVVLGSLVWMSRRGRWALTLVVGASFAVPWLITVVTLDTFGTAWQGRYALPLLVGGGVLAAWSWSRGPRRLGWQVLAPFGALVVLGQAAGPVAVLANERSASPLAGTTAWPAPHPVLLGALVVLGAAMLMVPAIVRAAREERIP